MSGIIVALAVPDLHRKTPATARPVSAVAVVAKRKSHVEKISVLVHRRAAFANSRRANGKRSTTERESSALNRAGQTTGGQTRFRRKSASDHHYEGRLENKRIRLPRRRSEFI